MGSPANDAGISLSRLPYDDADWHVDLYATNGYFAARQDFYVNPQMLADFATGLTSFPKALGDEIRFELGALTGNWAYYVLLHAYHYDMAGHSALELFVDKRGAAPYRQQSNFHIICEAAATNRLGTDLQEWISVPNLRLIWTPKGP
jgi:hypothetical protein